MDNRTIKFLCDLGPVLVFFVAYKLHSLYAATVALIIATIIAVIVEYYYQRKISWLPIITVAIVALMGGLTIFSGNEMFIKVKPTIVNALFALVLGVGLCLDKLLVKHMFGKSLQMPDEAWRNFTLRWVVFFIVMACLNEVVWRNFSTAQWVNFKVFGILGLTLGFMVAQYPFLKRYSLEETNQS